MVQKTSRFPSPSRGGGGQSVRCSFCFGREGTGTSERGRLMRYVVFIVFTTVLACGTVPPAGQDESE